jgi:hypothetical protein
LDAFDRRPPSELLGACLDTPIDATMGKRGRDEEVGSGTGVYGLSPAEPADDVRVMTAFAHRRHLNKRFLEDLQRKIAADPFCWLEKEVESYKKYARKIRVRRASQSRAGRASHSPRSFAPRPRGRRSRGRKETLLFRAEFAFFRVVSAGVSQRTQNSGPPSRSAG